MEQISTGIHESIGNANGSEGSFRPTVRGAAQAIMQMEVDLGLLEDETYGQLSRLVWEASRFSVHLQLEEHLTGHEAAHTLRQNYRQMDAFRFVRWAGNQLSYALLNGWTRAPRGREWLVLQNQRRKLGQNNVYDDVFTDELIGEIPQRRRVLLEDNYLWSHLSPTRDRVWYTDTSYLVSVAVTPIVKLASGRKLQGVCRMSEAVSNYLEHLFDVKLGMNTEWRRRAVSFERLRIASNLMLRWLRPSRILLVCSYGKEPLLVAAQQLQIPTVEVQHGVITPEHLGYAFPKDSTKQAFPDYLLLFGDYWRRNVSWPVPQARLITIGYPYFERVRQDLVPMAKKCLAVIISQGPIGPQLSKFATRLAESAKDHVDIVYKLHPGEIARWKGLYPALLEASRQGSLTVVDGDNPSLYDLLSLARWQIGVYSSAIFEGIGLGCITYLVDLPGIEYMEPLIQSGAVRVVSDPTEIDWTVSDATVDPNDFFAKHWRRNFREFLKRPLVSKGTSI